MNAQSSATRDAALALEEARHSRKPIAPVSSSHGIVGAEMAYAVAELNIQSALRAGRRVVGKKVGLTSKAVQQQLGVDQPDFGMLLDDMEYLNGQDVPFQRLIQPKVEAEVAFVMGSDLEATRPSWGEFLKSVAYALPALEIVDSAIIDWKISLVDTIADNASSGLFVLGDQPVSVAALSFGDLGMQMVRNGMSASVGNGAACLGHPLRAAYWLARTMADRGQALKAGEVILSGALGPMVALSAGDFVQADMGALGSVSCRMV